MPDITIDSRLKECRGTVELVLNLNTLLEIIDALEARVEALENPV